MSLRALLCPLALCLACSSPADGQGGSVVVQISGEAAAEGGFLFPTGSDVAFRDGWELHFTHVLVTVGDVTLAENPDKAPQDQAQTDEAVARSAGPWAVDLARPGALPAAGGDGSATELTTIARQNLHDGAAFAADRRYAFSYSVVRADPQARRVNFAGDEATESAYETMIERGLTVLYTGTATFKGAACASSDAGYDFTTLSSAVPFALGFATPTRYVNCQNQENQGEPFEGESYQRGIAVLPNTPALAQITLHLEHPFFSDTVHDSELFFDQMAARLDPTVARPLEEADLVGVDPTAFSDWRDRPLPWRACPADSSPVRLPPGRQRGFGVGHTLVDPQGNPRESFRDYRDFVNYVQSTQGHLNGGEGLCYVARDYPSPQ